VRAVRATTGSVLFFLVAPGTVVGLVPWLLTGWRMRDVPALLWVPGAVLLMAAIGFLVHAFIRFVVEGLGTPAPVAPPRRLVVGGVYRHVRNPMYLAVVTAVAGQALVLGQPALLWYAVVIGLLMAGFVKYYEEPQLRQRYGPAYDTYRRAVPAWLPRLRPWRPPANLAADPDR
jgi:protein-S-isoprenylcysteine O-methyltransferase Ste14